MSVLGQKLLELEKAQLTKMKSINAINVLLKVQIVIITTRLEANEMCKVSNNQITSYIL